MVPVCQHDAPVKDVASVMVPTNNQSLVITGGWDAKVKFWIWQSPQQLQQIADIYVAMPVHYMSCTWPLLVTAHQSRFIHIWNLQNCAQQNNWNPTEI